MGGGIIQLVSLGIPDIYLTSDPQITWFKILFRRYTEFAMVDYQIRFNGDLQFGSENSAKIGPLADKLERLALIVDIPTPEVKMKDPTVSTIQSVIDSVNLPQLIAITLSFDPPKNDNSIVKYDDLFNDDPNSLGSKLIIAGQLLNLSYDIRLDILDYFGTNFSIDDNKYIGRYIAIQANGIQFPVSQEQIDKQGYLLATFEKTKEIILSDTKVFTLDEKSWMYNHNTTTNRDLIPYTPYPTPNSRFPTSDELIKIYPNIIPGFQQITSAEQLNPINFDVDANKYHLIFSVDYLRKLKQRLLTKQSDIIKQSDDVLQHMIFDELANRPLLFNDFDYNEMLGTSEYETGIWLFEIPDNISDNTYDEQIIQVLNNMRLSVDTKYIDTDFTELEQDQQKFNRFSINENATYDPSWEFGQGSIDGFTGYWLLDMNLFDANQQNQNNITISNQQNTIIKFNPLFLSSNADRLGFAPYIITNHWQPSIVTNQPLSKINNLINSVSIVDTLFENIYQIPSIANSPSDDDLLVHNNNVADLHRLLVSMYNDTMNNENQPRNYKLNDPKIFNSIDIRDKMYELLIDKIIYVDQHKLGTQYSAQFTQAYIKKQINDSFILNTDAYQYDPLNPTDFTDQAMIVNRQIVYQNAKYLMWSYYCEQLLPISDPASIAQKLKELSFMLFQVPKIPININPEDTDPNIMGTDDPTTQDIKFTLNQITDTTNCQIYEDEIIEEFNQQNQDDYIYAGSRYPLDQTQETIGTCINREVEFYHVIDSFLQDQIITNIDIENLQAQTVSEYFFGLIIERYRNMDSRNYLNTVSYRAVETYLNNYYKNVQITDPLIQLDLINNDLLNLIHRTINLNFIYYIHNIFGVWKNSNPRNIEINPQIISVLDDSITYVPYNANYVMNYINAIIPTVSLGQKPNTQTDPMLLRTKFFTGINISLRPLMGFSFSYDISYPLVPKEKSLNINTSNGFIAPNNNVSDPKIVIGADFKDRFGVHIDQEVQRVRDLMVDSVKYNQTIKDNISYYLWHDLNVFMKIIINDLNTDLGLSLEYFENISLLNHLPLMIMYYYGQYMQYIVNTQIKQGLLLDTPSSQETLDHERNSVEDIVYDLFPISSEGMINDKNFNVEPDPVPDVEYALRFLGTDVRMDPECPFHGKVKDLPNYQTMDEISNDFMIKNQYNQQISEMCPLCFRTIEYRRMFELIVSRTLLDATINDPNKISAPVLSEANLGIIDYQYVESLTENDNVNIINETTDTTRYTTFLYRPEDVIYDPVTRTYFYIPMEFVIHRIAEIMFRYKTMIKNIIAFSPRAFNNWIRINLPERSRAQIEINRFDNYVAYLRKLRDESLSDLFDRQMNNLIAEITQVIPDSDEFVVIRKIYDNLYPDLSKEYEPAISYIGLNSQLTEADGYMGGFKLLPSLVYDTQNIQVIPTVGELSITRYQMYRGNIILWVLIQYEIITSFNNYFNNVLDFKTPDKIETDLHAEIYQKLKTTIKSDYVNDNDTIDFYRCIQTRGPGFFRTITNKNSESVQLNDFLNDFTDSVCTDMINYCRHLQIYYNMLISRYNKLSFLLQIQSIGLNTESFYYEFSQLIAEGYLNDILKTIQGMGVIVLNEQNDKQYSKKFYYTDTSQYYFLNKLTFRNNIANANDPSHTNDYLLFDPNNNYHLSQSYTLNQFSNLLRMLGLHDVSITNVPSTTTNSITYNNNFSFYQTIDTNSGTFNNYSDYLYEDSVQFTQENGYFIVRSSHRIFNHGLYNEIWYKCPTVSNILYDQYYTPEIIELVDQSESVIRYTECLVTSPLIFIRDKLVNAISTPFTHTKMMMLWEDIMVEQYSGPDSDDYIFNMGLLYLVYQFFFGSYNLIDMQSEMNEIKGMIINSNQSNSIGSEITQYQNIINSIIDQTLRVFEIKDLTMRNEQLFINLALAQFKVVKTINMLKQEHTNLVTQIFNALTNISTNISVRSLLNEIRAMVTDISARILSININTDINYVKANIQNIMNEQDFEFYFRSNSNSLVQYYATFQQDISNKFTELISLTQFQFIETNQDLRTMTPQSLYGLQSMKIFNNFKTYHDILLFLAVTLFVGITPHDRTQSIVQNIQSHPLLVSLSDTTISDFDTELQKNTYNQITQYMIKIVEDVRIPMSKIVYLPRYIDTSKKIVNGYVRYNLNLIIIENDQTFAQRKICDNYYDQKQKKLKAKDRIVEEATKKIRADNEMKRQAKLRAKLQTNLITNKTQREIIDTVATYIGSDLYEQIVSILNSEIPKHAWVRYLGYRMIEEVSLIIDGERIDSQSGDLMLLLHKLTGTVPHKRGDDIMLGNIPEMYTISDKPRPRMRLYVKFFFFFCQFAGNSLSLLNTLYSDIKIRIKLRDINQLLFIEPGGELKKPVKIKCQMLGNYIYLSDEERKTTAITRMESLIERFTYGGTLTRSWTDLKNNVTTDNGIKNNILKLRYYYNDPCKYFLWKIHIDYPVTNPKDKIFWDLADYRVRGPDGSFNLKSKIIEVVKNTMIELNGKSREKWKDSPYYRLVQPWNKYVNSLDPGEFFYSFCLFPGLLQPSGTTNFSEIDNLTFYFEINEEIANLMKTTGIKLRIMMWECSYNLFVAMSGFGALRFYSSFTFN